MTRDRNAKHDALQWRRAKLSADAAEELRRRLSKDTAGKPSPYRDATATMRAWQAHPSLSISWQTLTRAAEDAAARVPSDLRVADYVRINRELDKRAFATIFEVLNTSGVFNDRERAWSLDEIVEQLGCIRPYRRLVMRWLQTLVHRDLISLSGGRFRSSTRRPETLWQEPMDTDMSVIPRKAQAKAGGAGLSDADRVRSVLRGHLHGLESFSVSSRGASSDDGYLANALQAFERDRYSRYLNDIVAELLACLVRPDRTLRILEVGAGVGATSARAFQTLRGQPVEYVFTDVSTGFLSYAAGRFRGEDFVSYALLDLDTPRASGDYPERAFDVILAANSLHCARRVGDSLRELAALLVPGGLLVLREGICNHPFLLVSQGLLVGASVYEDERLRDDLGPLLDHASWRQLCSSVGFSNFAAFPADDHELGPLDERVMIAALPP